MMSSALASRVFPFLQQTVVRSCRWYQSKLVQRPCLVKGLTSGGILGTADYLSQKIRNESRWDRRQTFLMACYGGMCVAPFCHNWYKLLERIVPIPVSATTAVKLRLAAKRMLIDQIFAAPIFTGGFFISRGIVAGESAAGIKEKMKKDFFKVLCAGVVVWPQAQLINFFFVPLNYRVLYSNTVGLGWSTFTSVVASYEREKTVQRVKVRKPDLQHLAAACLYSPHHKATLPKL